MHMELSKEFLEDDDSKSFLLAAIGGVVAGLVLLCLASLLLYYFFRRRMHRQEESKTRDPNRNHAMPPSIVKRVPLSKFISSMPPGSSDFPSESYSGVEGSSVCGQSVFSSSQQITVDVEAKEQFVRDFEDDSSLLEGCSKSLEIEDSVWLQYTHKLTSLNQGVVLGGEHC